MHAKKADLRGYIALEGEVPRSKASLEIQPTSRLHHGGGTVRPRRRPIGKAKPLSMNTAKESPLICLQYYVSMIYASKKKPCT